MIGELHSFCYAARRSSLASLPTPRPVLMSVSRAHSTRFPRADRMGGERKSGDMTSPRTVNDMRRPAAGT